MNNLNSIRKELEVLGHSDLANMIKVTGKSTLFYSWYQEARKDKELRQKYKDSGEECDFLQWAKFYFATHVLNNEDVEDKMYRRR